MTNRFNTIRNQLLGGFLFFTLLIVFLSAASYWYSKKEEEIRLFKNWFDQLHLLSISLVKQDMDFLSSETVNPSFFETGKSDILRYRSAIRAEIQNNFPKIRQQEAMEDFDVDTELVLLDSLLQRYENTFHKMVEKILIKGFKGYGLLGEMQQFALKLEETHYQLDFNKILLLRNNEKDFYIRNEKIYAEKLNQISGQILSDLNKNPEKYAEVIEAIKNYTSSFNDWVRLENEIGLVDQTGLKNDLNILSAYIENEFETVSTGAELREAELLEELQNTFTMISLVCILVSLVMSYVFASRITSPIRVFSQAMKKVIESDFSSPKLPALQTSAAVEMLDLQSSFSNMVQKIQDQLSQMGRQHDELKLAITKLAESEKSLKDTNMDKDKFFSIIAHDLKGPIATLTSFLTILVKYSDGFTKEEIKDVAIKMSNSVNNLSVLLENLLAWSRSQLGTLVYYPVDINISDIVLKNINLADSKAKQKGIDILTDYPENLSVFADENMVDFIIRNLVSNALKFTNTGGRICISAKMLQGNKVEVSVADNGVGISAEDLKKIFKKDAHLSKQGTAQEAGTGLGLMLCKEFVEKNGGTIWAESENGRGAIFRFTLQARGSI